MRLFLLFFYSSTRPESVDGTYTNIAMTFIFATDLQCHWVLYFTDDLWCCAMPTKSYNQLVGWLSGRTSVSDRRTFTGPHRTCSWWVTIYMGKPSAVGQPTRPTQPFILIGSIPPYPPLGLIWAVMLVWRKGNINRTVSVL